MSTTQTIATQDAAGASGGEAPPRARRKGSASDADFGAFFAQFAQTTALGAARNGSMSLGVGRVRAQGSDPAPAQELPGVSADGAQGRPGLRSEEGAGASADGQRRGRTPAGESAEGGAARDRAAPHDRASGGGERGEQAPAGDGRTARGAEARNGNRAEGGAAKKDAGGAGAQPGVAAPLTSGAGAGAARVGAPGNPQNPGVVGVGKAGGGAVGAGSAGGLFAELQSQAKRAAQAPVARQAARQPGPQQSEAFRAQLMQGLSAALRQGRGQVTLRLRPDSLGELEVRLQMKGSTVNARITPSTVEAQRLLEQNIDSLRQSFEARGLQPGRIEVQPPAEGKDAHAGGGGPGGQDGLLGGGGEDRRSPEEPAGGRDAGGAPTARASEGEDSAAPEGLGSPGVVYGVADGAARLVMVDALA
ncbi:MAG: flagellar hook-length control protein FliK [Phycisphaerales bacterium]|nr:flagellar hook-length control protein FliK [Phycisphaerales bacterium]